MGSNARAGSSPALSTIKPERKFRLFFAIFLDKIGESAIFCVYGISFVVSLQTK